MERTTFLEHYRVGLGSDGTPNELGRDGAVIAYDAVDERSGEPVALTLVPVASIDPALREQFEEQARAVQRLRHVNIAKVFDFGPEGGWPRVKLTNFGVAGLKAGPENSPRAETSLPSEAGELEGKDTALRPAR